MRLGRASRAALAATLMTSAAALAGAPAASAAVVPTYDPQAGSLTVLGDGAANEIVIGRDVLGVVTVNGKVPQGGAPGVFPTVFNLKSMVVFGLSGNDVIRLDEANGPLPAAQVFAGAGDDVVTGGSGGDQLHGQDGNDRLQGAAGADFLLGQGGDDIVNAGDGVDTLFGGLGADSADGDRGDDTVFLGDGDDLALWDPGDGSDRIEGELGFDAFQFRGSGADEKFQVSREGVRARLTRDVGAVAIGANDVERLEVEPVGGSDTLTLGDLTGTAVQELRADLEAVRGGGAPDTGRDRLVLDGTGGDDFVDVLDQGGKLFVLGLPTFVTVERAEATRDELRIATFGGDDRIEAGSMPAGTVRFEADGGAGADMLAGTAGGDSLLGGEGDDFVDGRRGADTALLGPGDDLFTARRGDGGDQVAGEAGADRVELTGSSAGEQFRAAASGGLARFTSVGGGASDSVDGHEVEAVRMVSFGGADTVTVDDLSSAGVTSVTADLSDLSVPGGQADSVIVNGTAGADRVGAEDAGGVVDVAGLFARVRVTGAEPLGDRLEIRAGAGDDVIDASRLSRDRIRFRGEGQEGNDVLRAGPGDDVLDGGPGFDSLNGGGGADVLLNGEGRRPGA